MIYFVFAERFHINKKTIAKNDNDKKGCLPKMQGDFQIRS